jgi:hypothetical protein
MCICFGSKLFKNLSKSNEQYLMKIVGHYAYIGEVKSVF